MEHAGIWSVAPPLIAITLALITKEVIFSLLIGIMSGALIHSLITGLGPFGIFTVTVNMMITKLSDGDNAAMVIFLALLGALIAVITRAGGSNAYGAWAVKKIRSRESAGLLTAVLGFIIFIDDYFNCLTVGTVMRPVTDRFGISREKLAYLIDATAAPVCIIAPISSWAASVISYYPAKSGMSGMQAFISAIPMNLYAVLTIVMVLMITLRKNSDFGPMARAQRRIDESGTNVTSAAFFSGDESDNQNVSPKGKVPDLIIPAAMLVIFSILAMLYSGGYWDEEGKTLFMAFGDTEAGPALALGGFSALIAAFLLFVPRKIINLKDFFTSAGTGFKTMVPAIVILILAWTISGICRDLLNTGIFVAGLVKSSSMPVALIPSIMFLTAAVLSFATGTSWGTFGILIPITISICDIAAPHLSVISLSAVLAGSVFGDHCSPISDTTILSSTGARCNHIDHVATQMPYALVVAAVCLIGYFIAGFISPLGFGVTTLITVSVSTALLITTLIFIPKIWREA